MWRCCRATSHEDLIQQLGRAKVFSDTRVRDALIKTDRGDFVQANAEPYVDAPQPIGVGATISAPHMHATAMELLKDQLISGAHVLDVGSGSGYLACAFAHMVGPHGKVVGIEHIQELVDISIENTKKSHEDFLTSGRLIFEKRDGFQGAPDNAPYQAIHVGAAAPTLPSTLVQQLANNGRMIIPIGPEGRYQYLACIDKDEQGRVHQRKLMDVAYVPLTDEAHQRSSW